jgi:hypothetical protein
MKHGSGAKGVRWSVRGGCGVRRGAMVLDTNTSGGQSELAASPGIEAVVCKIAELD